MKYIEMSKFFMYNFVDVFGNEGNKMIRDILYALELGMKVIGAFVFCIIVGINLDNYLNTSPVFILIFIILAFAYVMRLLLGEIWR